ncbi:MAG TPA: DNA-processing protein DprA, partial [Microbacterium sp.]|nr:DNA-processing protein DprA [Microbacterium sp.]
MTTITLSAAGARRALGAIVEAADDADAVTAYARAVWSVLTEPSDRIAGTLIPALGPVAALEAVLGAGGVPAAARDAGVGSAEFAAARSRWMPRIAGVEHPLELARRAGVQLVTPEDADWPLRAHDLGPGAPICLWLRGDARVLAAPGPAVALVGARAATSYGEHVATELAAEAALGGITVVSGGAYG